MLIKKLKRTNNDNDNDNAIDMDNVTAVWFNGTGGFPIFFHGFDNDKWSIHGHKLLGFDQIYGNAKTDN